jgi:hypothetical protein
LHRRSLVASTGAVASRHGIIFSQLLIDMAKWVLRALMSVSMSCMFYWGFLTVIWKSTAAIWSCVLKRPLLELVTLFFEIKIEHSQRGTHVWVRRRGLSWVLPFLKSLGRLLLLDYCISIVGTLSAILVAHCTQFRERGYLPL